MLAVSIVTTSRIIPGMTRSTHSYGGHPSQVGELFLPARVRPVRCGGRRPRRVLEGAVRPLAHDRALHRPRRARPGRVEPRVPARRRRRRMARDFLDVAAGVDALAGARRAARPRAGRRGRALGGRPARALGRRRGPTLPDDAPGSRPRVAIAAAVSQAGVLDLALAAGLMPSSTPTRALLGDPTKHYERYVLASPRERLPLGIPQLVLHGDRDDTVSMRIATSYAAAARAGRRPVRARRPDRGPATSSTSTPAPRPGTSRATGWSLRRAPRAAERRSARALGGPSSAASSAAEPDDDAVRELGRGGRLLGRRDAEARVERHVRQRARPLDERARAPARARRARRSSPRR